ncbi:MAG: glycosyltransferase [Candidatus Paceibacterota bacterium]
MKKQIDNILDITILLPTFNESKNVLPLINEISEVLNKTSYSYEILFIDDSTDSTPDILRKAQQKNKQVRFRHRTNGTGLATALIDGFKIARGNVICCMDADLQHPPELIPKLYKKIEEGYTMSVASRLVDGGSSTGLGSLYRHIISRESRLRNVS